MATSLLVNDQPPTPLRLHQPRLGIRAEQSFDHSGLTQTQHTQEAPSLDIDDADPQKAQKAATVIQATYRGYQARQELYGPPILPSQKWRRLIDYSRLEYIHTMDVSKPLSPTSPTTPTTLQKNQESKVRLAWRRAEFLGSRLAKGSSRVSPEEALILLAEHWLEMSDRKHRYGSNLKVYHEYWLKQDTTQNFFYWLDKGEGKDVDLKARPRSILEEEQVRYLQEHERSQYEVHVVDGLLCYKTTGKPVHTLPESVQPGDVVDLSKVLPDPDPADDEATRLEKKAIRGKHKFIYVTDPRGTLYIGNKIKGRFHHSSFLGGGSVAAAGAVIANHGKLLKINPRSGHYRPGLKHFYRLLDHLKQSNLNLDNAQISLNIHEDEARDAADANQDIGNHHHHHAQPVIERNGSPAGGKGALETENEP